MPFSQTNIGRVRLGKQAAWNDATISWADRHVVEAEVFLPELSTEILQTQSMRGNYAAYRSVSGGKSNISISLRMPMHGYSATSPSGDPSASNQHAEALILEYALGGASYVAAVGSTTHSSTGSAATTTFASGDAISDGKAVLVPISGTPTYSIGWVKDVSGDDCTWISPLSSAAHASTTCKPALLQYMATGSPSTGLVMNYQGQDSNTDITLSNGMVTSCKITMNPNAQPMLEAELVFGAWALGASGAPGIYEYTLPQMPVSVGNNGARFMINGVANANVFSCELDIAVAYQPVLGHSAAEGISQYVVTDRDVTMTVSAPTSNAAAELAVTGGTVAGPIQVDANTTAGRAFSLLIPSSIVENTVTLGDNNGVVGSTTVYKAGYYDNDGSDTAIGTAPADTIVRTAFL